MPTTQPIDSRLGSVLAFRRATAGDAAALAPLVLASGRQEFDWFLGVPPAECEAFLRHAIAAPSGRFSWKRHLVATLDGQPVAALAIQDGRKNRLDDLYAVRDFLQHFGPRRTPGITPNDRQHHIARMMQSNGGAFEKRLSPAHRRAGHHLCNPHGFRPSWRSGSKRAFR